MAGRRKFGARELKRAISMRQTGASMKQIGAALDCSYQLVSLRLREAEDAGEQLPVARTGRPRKDGGGTSIEIQRGPKIEQRLGELDIPTELAMVRSEWLPAAKQHADEAFARGDRVGAKDWMKIYIETAERLMQAIPPPPPDPREDPRNLEARREVVAKFEDLAEEQHRRLAEMLCGPCAAQLAS